MSSRPSKKSASTTRFEARQSPGTGTLVVERCVSVSPKCIDRYHAFPTLIKTDDTAWLACRSGVVDTSKPHGDNGCIRLFSAPLDDPLDWHEYEFTFDCRGPHGNELDAILSGPFDGSVFLATRDYGPGGNTPFLSMLTLDTLQRRPTLLRRVPLGRMLTEEIGLGACFGHIRRAENGDLLMPYYGVLKGGRVPSPVLLASTDFGQSWHIRAVLANSDVVGAYLNEFSIFRRSNRTWAAVVRTNQPPHPLYTATSQDDGITWSPLTETGLFGHAPMLESGRGGGAMLLYRDLAKKQPGIGIAEERGDNTWHFVGSIKSYTGGLYDGGYGDLITLGAGRYLAAGYFSDEDGSPWVDTFLLTLA